VPELLLRLDLLHLEDDLLAGVALLLGLGTLALWKKEKGSSSQMSKGGENFEPNEISIGALCTEWNHRSSSALGYQKNQLRD
jgi:hypothetical protein